MVGSEEKRRYALETLGCTDCINRHDEKPAEALKKACPNGVNVYFDLVGGSWLQLANTAVGIRRAYHTLWPDG